MGDRIPRSSTRYACRPADCLAAFRGLAVTICCYEHLITYGAVLEG